MSEPFIGEVRVFGFNFSPRYWAFCNGQMMSIQQNAALFSILGTTYGGNGTTNFALPNLQGRVTMGPGQGPGLSVRSLGEMGGSDYESLTINEMPVHNHVQNCIAGPPPSGSGTPASASGFGLASGAAYAAAANGTMNPAVIGNQGNGAPHNNLQPYLVLNFCIALVGYFPSRN
jgi:microcystin-dependent protein